MVTRGYLGRPVHGTGEEASCESAGHSVWFMAWILDCLFTSAFELCPLCGECGPHQVGAEEGVGVLGQWRWWLQSWLGDLGLGW